MHPLNTNEDVKMKQIEYFGRVYDIKEDDVVIGINTYYQIFTKSNNGEYNFLESRNDLIGKVNILPQTMAIASEEPKPHPHADLMLKYAMIAQYDDKPWESFEVLLDGEWVDCEHEGLYAGIEYRLKPQEPKIKFGQVWIDFNGTQATVKLVSGGVVFFDVPVGGINMQHSLEQDYFLQNFNLKENK